MMIHWEGTVITLLFMTGNSAEKCKCRETQTFIEILKKMFYTHSWSYLLSDLFNLLSMQTCLHEHSCSQFLHCSCSLIHSSQLYFVVSFPSMKLNISCTDVSHISSGSKAIICSGKVFNVKRLQEVLRFIHDSLSVKKQRTAKLDRLDLITEWEIKLNWTEQQLNLSREL